jgi:hypothetical protein
VSRKPKPGLSKLKIKLSLLLYVLSFISLAIGIYQFTKGTNTEGVLSLFYAAMFLTAGIINNKNRRRAAK